MTALRQWLAFSGGLVLLVLVGAMALVLAGRGDLAQDAIKAAIAVSAIGLGFSTLMAGIIVWSQVRTARVLGTVTAPVAAWMSRPVGSGVVRHEIRSRRPVVGPDVRHSVTAGCQRWGATE